MEEKEGKKEAIKKEEVKKEDVKKVENKKEEKKQNTKVENKKEGKKEVKKEKAQVENKKGNRLVIPVAIVAIIIVALLVYIVFMVDSPKKAVEAMFREAKSGADEEGILSGVFQDENVGEETKKAIFENLSWKVLNETQEGDTATVEVEITNKDFGKIIDNFKERIVKAAFGGEQIDEAKTQEYLLEEINNEEVENVTNTHSITVEKQDGKWQITEENNIVDILLPGFTEAIDSLY